MENFLKATPAYNRVYKNESDLLSDWYEGKDFKIVGGSYFSIRDTDALIHNMNVDILIIDGVFIPLK